MSKPMRRTGWSDLATPFIVVAALSYLLLRLGYGSIPRLTYAPAVPLAALALIEFLIARRVQAAVSHRADAKPITALVIARYVALAKASSLVGAGLLGALAGLLVRVLPDFGQIDAARNDTFVALALVAVTVALVAAALLLERAAVDPNVSRRR
jgi:Protein of unknown function (DUF3180)